MPEYSLRLMLLVRRSGGAEILTQPGTVPGDKLRALDADPHSDAGTRQAVLSAPTSRIPRGDVCGEEEAQGSLAILWAEPGLAPGHRSVGPESSRLPH